MIVGFNVRPNAEARALAEREGVEIRTYNVIYRLTEDIEQALVGMLKPVTTEETLGEAEVRALFRVSRLGTIAGCHGHERRRPPERARCASSATATVIYDTTISQLKRFKDDVREVEEGFECGILLDGFNDVKEGDILEVYEVREIERTDLEPAARRRHRPHQPRAMGAGLRRDPLGRAPLPGGGLAEGQAQARASRRRRSSRTASAPRWPRSTTTSSGSARG